MKKIVLLFVIIVSCFGCKKSDTELNGVKVYLIETDDPVIFNKSVILYDDNDYIIKTPLDTFLIGYPFLLDGYSEMKTKAINDALINDALDVSDYMKYARDSVFTLAYHLEKGSCYIFDKHLNESIKTILVETYMEGEPMAYTGGRRFYIKGRLFLETLDLISK